MSVCASTTLCQPRHVYLYRYRPLPSPRCLHRYLATLCVWGNSSHDRRSEGTQSVTVGALKDWCSRRGPRAVVKSKAERLDVVIAMFLS